MLSAARPCIFILESFAMCCWPHSLFYHNSHMLLAASYNYTFLINSHMLLAARPCLFTLESLAMCCWPCSLFSHKQPYVVGCVIELYIIMNSHMLLAGYVVYHYTFPHIPEC